MEVNISKTSSKGHAYIGDEKNPEAEMTFSMAGNTKMIIDHTEVGASLKGKEAGKKMLLAIVEMARKENIKIIPLCPFANSVFKKDASIRDVLV